MACFAELDKDGVVLRVIVIDEKTLATGRWGDAANWVETKPDDAQKKNYASAGFTLDKVRDAFIPPRPAEALSLDESKCRWIVFQRPTKGVIV